MFSQQGRKKRLQNVSGLCVWSESPFFGSIKLSECECVTALGSSAWACLLLCKDWYSRLMLLLPATSVSDVCLDFIHYSCMFHYKIFCPSILFKHSTDQNKHCGHVNRVQMLKKNIFEVIWKSKLQMLLKMLQCCWSPLSFEKQSYYCWMASSAPGWLAVLAIPLGLAADHNQHTCC